MGLSWISSKQAQRKRAFTQAPGLNRTFAVGQM